MNESVKLWRRMDQIAHSSKKDLLKFCTCLVDAYNHNLDLIIACAPSGENAVGHAYMDTALGRAYLAYTSMTEAEKEYRGASWDIVSARDVLNNLFNRRSAAAIVFNATDEHMMIVPL